MVEPLASYFGSRLHCCLVVLPAVHAQTDRSKATTLALLFAPSAGHALGDLVVVGGHGQGVGLDEDADTPRHGDPDAGAGGWSLRFLLSVWVSSSAR